MSGDFGLTKAFDDAGLSGHSATGAAAGAFGFMARKFGFMARKQLA